MPKNLIISVESRKGGVGKTMTALTLARCLLRRGFEVLLLDLDITGTDSTEMLGVPPWSGCVHWECLSDGKSLKRVNIVELFRQYMCGEDSPAVRWREGSVSENEDKGLILLRHRVNILGSFIDRPGRSDKGVATYPPGVLFDEMHAVWFMEMTRAVIADAEGGLAQSTNRSAETAGPLAVVIDNSPGYTGIQPALEEWLTDRGTEQSKFLFVASIDSQDLAATADSMLRLRTLFDKKLLATAEAIQLLRSPEEASMDHDTKFATRLLEALSGTCSLVDGGGHGSCGVGCRHAATCSFSSHVTTASQVLDGLEVKGSPSDLLTDPEHYVPALVGPGEYMRLLINKVPRLARSAPDQLTNVWGEYASGGNHGRGKPIRDCMCPQTISYNEALGWGFAIESLKQQEKVDSAAPAGRKSPQEARPPTSSQVQSKVADLYSALFGPQMGTSGSGLAEDIVSVVFDMDGEFREQLGTLGQRVGNVWFDELSPIADLIGVVPSVLSVPKARRLAGSTKIDRSNWRLAAQQRCRGLQRQLSSFLDSLRGSFDKDEMRRAQIACPIIAAGVAVNSALSSAPVQPGQSASGLQMRVIAASRIPFPEASAGDEAFWRRQISTCFHQAEMEDAEKVRFGSAGKGLSQDLLRDAELRQLVKTSRKMSRLPRIPGEESSMAQLRLGVCRFLFRLSAYASHLALVRQIRGALQDLDESTSIFATPIVDVVLRHRVCDANWDANRAEELIGALARGAAMGAQETLTAWLSFRTVEQIEEAIDSCLKGWGIDA